MKKLMKIRHAPRTVHVRKKLRPLLLALLCPLMAYADGDVGVKATVCEGTTVKESAMFQLSKTPRISFDSDGKLVMRLGDSSTNVAELPMNNGAQMRVTFTDYDVSQNSKSVTVSSINYSTLYSAFQLTVPEGVEVYAPEYDAEKKVLNLNDDTKVAEGTVLPPGTGIILKNQGTYDIAYSDETPTPVTSALTGSVVAAPVSDFDGIVYSLAEENGVVAFFKYAQNKIVGGEAYLVLPITQQADLVSLMPSGSDASVGEVFREAVTTPTYNLAGQRVGNGYSGIIIQKGKKSARVK